MKRVVSKSFHQLNLSRLGMLPNVSKTVFDWTKSVSLSCFPELYNKFLFYIFLYMVLLLISVLGPKFAKCSKNCRRKKSHILLMLSIKIELMTIDKTCKRDTLNDHSLPIIHSLTWIFFTSII